MSATIDPTEVLTLLSQERMSWYKKDPNSWRLLSDADALRRYEDQATLQAKTWVFIGGVEVILRNALHHALTDRYGAWHDEDSPFVRVLAAPDAKRLREAHRTCEADRARRSRTSGNAAIEPGHVVAALTFGFWRKLLSRSYDRTLWVPTLHNAFLPGTARRRVYDAADRLNIQRNRIAHHERIANPHQIRQAGQNLAGAIHPQAELWVSTLWNEIQIARP